MFPNETFCGGREDEDEDDEVVEGDNQQLMQRTSTSAVLHGRLDPGPSPFAQKRNLANGAEETRFLPRRRKVERVKLFLPWKIWKTKIRRRKVWKKQV